MKEKNVLDFIYSVLFSYISYSFSVSSRVLHEKSDGTCTMQTCLCVIHREHELMSHSFCHASMIFVDVFSVSWEEEVALHFQAM